MIPRQAGFSMYRFAGAAIVLVWVSMLSAAPARAGDEAVGTLTEVTGTVRLLRGENVLETQRGVEVVPQDIVETGVNGAVQIDLKDGSVLRLGPGSRLALSDYKLDKDRNVISATVDVLTGWLRFAVSKLRKDDSKYRINAPSLTIGIRGTEGVVEADAQEGGVHLVSGRIEVGGQDAQGKPLAPVQVNAGEYIQRLQGQAFRRLPAPPPAFQNRVPPVVVRKLAVLPLRAGERPVIQPRVLRKLSPVEAQQFIRHHPHAKDLLQRRFQPLLGPGAPDGGRLKGPAPGPHDGPSPGATIKPPIPPAGIGGQIPGTNRLAPMPGPGGLPPGQPMKPVLPPPGKPVMPGMLPPKPLPPPIGPGPGPNLRQGVSPPAGRPASGSPPRKPDDPGHEKSPPPDAPASAPSPPPKPPAGNSHPAPRQIIRKIRQQH
jgi:hypothetical protein